MGFTACVPPHRAVEVTHQLARAPGQWDTAVGYAQHHVLRMLPFSLAIDAQIVVRTLQAFVTVAGDALLATIANDVAGSCGY